METYKTKEVFVPVGLPDITFVVREHLDRSVKAWEMNRSKHLLIFGPSKSGKSSLWRKYIGDETVIKIPCNTNKTLVDIYQEIFFRIEK